MAAVRNLKSPCYFLCPNHAIEVWMLHVHNNLHVTVHNSRTYIYKIQHGDHPKYLVGSQYLRIYYSNQTEFCMLIIIISYGLGCLVQALLIDTQRVACMSNFVVPLNAMKVKEVRYLNSLTLQRFQVENGGTLCWRKIPRLILPLNTAYWIQMGSLTCQQRMTWVSWFLSPFKNHLPWPGANLQSWGW